MPITIYKKMLSDRLAASGWPNRMTEADLNAVQSLADKADDSLLKPIARKSQGTKFSLYNIDQVPSIKIGRLGIGNYGKVYLHIDGQEDPRALHVYAVKVVHLDSKKEQANNNLRIGVEHEIAVLKGMGDFIRSGERKCSDGTIKLYTVMRYFNAPTLDQFLKDKSSKKILLTPSQALDLMQKLTEQLERIHALNYAHGDLHTGNILVKETETHEMIVKLIDFNLSRPENDFYYITPPVNKGEYPHIPEECCGTNYIYFTPASDVYALGAVFNGILRMTEEAQDSVGNDFKTMFRQLTRKMRAHVATRLTLPMVNEHLQNIRFAPPAPKLDYLPLQTDLPISNYTKDQAIAALAQYLTGQHTWRSFLSIDSTFTPKSLFMQDEIRQLQRITLKSEFCAKLAEGLINYVKRFVINDLDHYVHQPNLGRGIECFINALKACRDEIDMYKLMEDFRKSLPKDDQQCAVFLEKFQTQMSVSSLGNTSEHSAGSYTHK